MDSVKPTESQSEPILAGGSMVGSGEGAKPLKRAENAASAIAVRDDSESDIRASDVVGYNTSKPVSPKNDCRKHPDPTLAQAVATMSFSGFTMAQVCSSLRISESTVRQYYDYEFKNGQSNLVNDIAGSLAQRALSGSDTAAIFLLKTRGKGQFSERTQLELTGKDGGPIQIEHQLVLDRIASALERGITIDHEPDSEQKKGGQEPAE
jgi:hypothetical protein